MKLDESWDYKKVIRDSLKVLSSRSHHPITLKKLALHLEMQYTYLSRLLNSEREHIKEDTLFEILSFLEFPEERIEALMNVRILQGSSSTKRKETAGKKLGKTINKKFSEIEQASAKEKLQVESAYLLDPVATLAFVALTMDENRRDPRRLQTILRLSRNELISVLEKIEAAGLIIRGEDPFEIKKLLSNKLHYSPGHTLIRLHQQQLALYSLQCLQRIPEDRKKVFMATFTADSEAFQKIQKRFQEFIETIETLSSRGKSEKLYQLNFQLFDWF